MTINTVTYNAGSRIRGCGLSMLIADKANNKITIVKIKAADENHEDAYELAYNWFKRDIPHVNVAENVTTFMLPGTVDFESIYADMLGAFDNQSLIPIK